MFTGLVCERGRLVAAPEPSEQGGVALRIGHSADLATRLEIGASLAVSGVCLTIVALELDGARCVSTVELSPETLRRTHLGTLALDSEVNLEPALRLGDPLGGHWVQGHVDGVITLVERRDLVDHRELTFDLPGEYQSLVVEKGSVTLDGVSLTVASLGDTTFDVALIPHTLDATTLGLRVAGDALHFEADVLAKYVQRAASVYRDTPSRPA